jgi:hypothetical protein
VGIEERGDVDRGRRGGRKGGEEGGGGHIMIDHNQ